jgi:ABC-type antimicrobial peptide transport system permease subunit
LETQITCGCEFSNGGPRAIVGVVDDVRQTALDSPVEPQVYLPESQMPYPGLHLVVRGAIDRSSLLPAIKREVAALDSRLAVSEARMLEEVVDESLARQRFSMTIIATFAASALLLAMVGLYGVIALSVGQRRREIAVRVALGARPGDVFRLIVGEGFRIAVAGVAIGLGGALATSRLLSALLYGVSATSRSVYGGATAAIVVVTLLATYLPARRAMRVDPTSALKAD